MLHYPTWPDPIAGEARRRRRRPDAPSNGDGVRWRDTERARYKRHALDAYRSQQLVMAAFIKEFERSNQLFIEGEPPAPFPCWCNGDNIAGIAIESR